VLEHQNISLIKCQGIKEKRLIFQCRLYPKRRKHNLIIIKRSVETENESENWKKVYPVKYCKKVLNLLKRILILIKFDKRE